MTAKFVWKATKRGKHGVALACKSLFHFYMVQISAG